MRCSLFPRPGLVNLETRRVRIHPQMYLPVLEQELLRYSIAVFAVHNFFRLFSCLHLAFSRYAQLISDHLLGGGTAFNSPGAGGFQRPLVVVMHRGMDLVSALRHNR